MLTRRHCNPTRQRGRWTTQQLESQHPGTARHAWLTCKTTLLAHAAGYNLNTQPLDASARHAWTNSIATRRVSEVVGRLSNWRASTRAIPGMLASLAGPLSLLTQRVTIGTPDRWMRPPIMFTRRHCNPTRQRGRWTTQQLESQHPGTARHACLTSRTTLLAHAAGYNWNTQPLDASARYAYPTPLQPDASARTLDVSAIGEPAPGQFLACLPLAGPLSLLTQRVTIGTPDL
ncbi:hypothetical protein Q31a_44880 [Aureliella helgolandensis]|uniref:Uncharacterized protein n=1 Tax=Aureliella helgolandensis TaxID=2527968 RepID=A0A518GBW4_9BACT|nr:hypothetical protein Q31a_44880 [Aureliella helgolandensis]